MSAQQKAGKRDRRETVQLCVGSHPTESPRREVKCARAFIFPPPASSRPRLPPPPPPTLTAGPRASSCAYLTLAFGGEVPDWLAPAHHRGEPQPLRAGKIPGISGVSMTRWSRVSLVRVSLVARST